MSIDVVAVPRSRSVALAAVVDEPSGGGPLSLVAEDGARFRFPADRAITRAVLDDGRDELEPRERLAALRAELAPFEDWLALHALLEDGSVVALDELARQAGLDTAEGRLRIALGLPRAEPWLRRDGAALLVVPTREALEKMFHLHAALFREAGDAAVKEWWPRRAEGVPGGWLDPAGDVALRARLALERARYFEVGYEPAPVEAGADALAALIDWALAGTAVQDDRGRTLAQALGLPDDPDQLIEHLVECGALGGDVEPAPHRAGLVGGFSADAEQQARDLVAAVPRDEGREDLSHEFAVAVDDADTREVDDALSLRRVGDELELLVHIADVASTVRPGTPLDAAVRVRASSLFLPDRSLLMFPPELVTARLTLAVGEARDALTGAFRLSPDGELRSSRFFRSRVRLTRRVTYDETRDPAALAPDGDAGRLLVHLCEALRSVRERRGARVLRLPSLKVSVDDGTPRLGLRLQDAPGDVVVAESMVLHNTRAGELLADAGVAALFRGQSAEVPAGRSMPEPGDPLYAKRVRRTFAPTETGVDPLPHAGLGAPAYVQCTSPIRRYADLVNQRQLAAAAHGETAPHDREALAALAPELHERERAVRRAADARAQYWTVRALQADGRTSLRGRLSKTPRRGLGGVWVPELCRELPLRAPRGWRAPAEGTELDWSVAALRPFRGRIELAPLEEEESR